MKTTNNTSYKYWIGSSNRNMKTSSNCIIKQPINIQTTYNYCFSEPGYFKDEKLASNYEALNARHCCKTRINQ